MAKGRQQGKRENRLNNLSSKEWLKFQKSWFVCNPRPRDKEVLLHPAKFPEELVAEFVGFFTKEGEVVFDPMAGTGSTLVAALGSGRSAIGIELSGKYAEIAVKRCQKAYDQRCSQSPEAASRSKKSRIYYQMYCSDAARLERLNLPQVDYCITSPPYWDMLGAKGFETQKGRKDKGLDVKYSEDLRDAGNIEDYEEFLDFLCRVYEKVHGLLKLGGYMTVIVKNVKKKGKIYPLAWDLASRLGKTYALKDEKIWCQDNQRLAPYGFGYAWVSNTMHHYCLNFRKE